MKKILVRNCRNRLRYSRERTFQHLDRLPLPALGRINSLAHVLQQLLAEGHGLLVRLHPREGGEALE